MSSSFPPPIDLSTTTSPPYTTTSPPSSSSNNNNTSSIIIVIIIIASAIIVSVCIYLLLQLLSRKFHHSFRTHSDVVVFSSSDHRHVTPNSNSTPIDNNENNHLLTSLPLFTFSSLGNLTTADCAVCLSKFQPHDQLRLLPLCCHAFHSECIDSWIIANQTCPLCRSMAFPSDADVLNKILPTIQNSENNNNNINNNSNSSSFRIEIGSVSNRRGNSNRDEGDESVPSRSYSIGGSFEYIVDENGYEVSVGSISNSHRRGASTDTKDGVPTPPGEVLAAEVASGSGRNWLRDYIDRASSSFRGSSGRFFTGSSRRNESVGTDLEANHRAGEEITEYFRWFSGY